MDIAEFGFKVETRSVDDAKTKLDALNRSAAAAEKQATLTERAFKILGGAIATVGISAMANSVLQASMAYQRMSQTVTFATGSMQLAKQEIAFIRQEAGRTGQDFLKAGQAYGQLSVAARQLGLTTADTRDIFSGVSAAASVMGLTADQAQGAFLALQQMLSKGTVQAEELRGQLGERIPGAVGDLAAALGISMQQLNKSLEQGQIMAKDAVTKLADYWTQKFGDQIPNATESAAIALNDFENRITDIKLKIAESGFMEVFLSALTSISEKLGSPEVLGAAEKLGESFKFIADNVDALSAALIALTTGGAVKVLYEMGRALVALEIGGAVLAAMAAPLSLIAAGIGAAAGAIYYFRDETIQFGDSVMSVGEIAERAFNTVKNVVYGTMQVVGGLAKNLWNAVSAIMAFVAQVGLIDVDDKLGLGKQAATDIADSVDGLSMMADGLKNIAFAYSDAKAEIEKGTDSLDDWMDSSYAATRTSNEAEKALKNLGKTAPPTEDAIKKLASSFSELEDRLDPSTELVKNYDASIKTLREAVDAGIVSHERELELLVLLNDQYQKNAREIIDGPTRAYEEKTEALRRSNAELRLEISGNKEAIPYLQDIAELQKEMGDELLPRHIAELQRLHREQNQLNKAIEDQEAATEKAKEAAAEWKRIWEHAAEGIQDSLTSMFRSVLDGNIKSFRDFGNSILDVFKNIAAQIAALLVFRPVVGGIVGALGLGSVLPQFAGAAGAGGGVSAFQAGMGLSTLGLSQAGTFANLYTSFATSGVGKFLGLGATTNGLAANGFMAGSLPGIPGATGATTGLTGFGAALGNGLQYSPWGIVGGLFNSAVGLGSGNAAVDFGLQTVGSIAGAAAGAGSIGAALGMGSSVGGPVGAIVGVILAGALGSLFKQKPSDRLEETVLDFATGSRQEFDLGPKKDDPQNRQIANQFTDSLEQLVNEVKRLTGGTLGLSRFEVGVGDRSGITVDIDGTRQSFTTVAEAWNFTADIIADHFQGVSETVQAALQNIDFTDPEKGLALVQFAVGLAELEKQAEPAAKELTAFGAAMKELDDKLPSLRENLIGIGQDAGRADTLISGAKNQLISDWVKSLDDELLRLTDPKALELRALDDWKTRMLEDAALAGQGLVQIEDIYAKKRAEILKKYGETVEATNDAVVAVTDSLNVAADVMNRLTAIIDDQIGAVLSQVDAQEQLVVGYENTVIALRRLRTGFNLDQQLSPLSPGDRLAYAREQFEAVAAAAMGGDPQAISELPDISRAFLESSRSYYASSEDYFRDFERVQSVLEQTESQQMSLLSVANNQLSILSAILETLKSQRDGIVAAAGASAQSGGRGATSIADMNELTRQYATAVNRSGMTEEQFLQSNQSSFWVAARDEYIGNLVAPAEYFQTLVGYAQAQQGQGGVFGTLGSSYEEAVRSRARELGLQGFQMGGVGSGFALVGEAGPEIVNFGSGSAAFSSEDSNAMFGGLISAIKWMGVGTMAVQNNILGEIRGLRGDVRELTEVVRSTGRTTFVGAGRAVVNA